MKCNDCEANLKRDEKFCHVCGKEQERGRKFSIKAKRQTVTADIIMPGVKKQLRKITEPEEVEVDEPDEPDEPNEPEEAEEPEAPEEPQTKYPWGDDIDDDDMDGRLEKIEAAIKLIQQKQDTLDSEMTWFRNNLLNWAVAYKDQMKKR